MKKYLIANIFLLTASSVLGQRNLGMNIINPDTLVARLGASYMQNPKAVGLSVGLFYNDKTYTYNFGAIEKNTAIQPTDQTIFAIGSISKTFISYVLAHAVLEKKVKLDDDIRKYLDGQYPNLEYDGKPILLKHLANTTSALPENLLAMPETNATMPADSIALFRQRAATIYTKQSFFDALHRAILDTIPGTRARHNNTAIQLLALILENVYHKSFSELVQDYVFTPLNMTHTTFLPPGSLPGLSAKGYDKLGDSIPFVSSAILASSGGITSTTADMLKYIILQLDKNNPAIQLAHKKSFTPDIYSIGLNWLIYKYNDGYSQIWTDGGTYGFASYIILYPEINTGIILLSNENDETSYGRLSGFADGIFNALKATKK